MRIVLYTGKGGVGKTTVAAATAVRCAELGYRTVVLSTDLAHSLADSFDRPLAPEPVVVAPNLWAQETDIYYNVRRYWGRVQEWVSMLLAWRQIDELIADELSVLPGMDELANLLWINNHRESGAYDVIIVDCAPTGETLRLLSFPDVARWWMEKIFPIHRRAAQVVRPLGRALFDLPVPDDEVYDAVKDLFGQLDELHTMLVDQQLTSVRLVLNPEKMVVKEAQRTYTYLNLFGYATDLVVCNRVLPREVTDHYFDAWKATQARYRQTVEEGFAPIPIRDAPLFGHEIVGLDGLREMAAALYGDADPSQVFFAGRGHHIEKHDGEYVLSLQLPFASKDQVAVFQTGDELVVHVGSQKRNVILPRALVGLQPHGARFEDGALRIRFVAPAAGTTRATERS
ncbi:MAG TPA: ArsA family ATPase [Chloroflexota bacterium]|nr:ArsA family ATPase [Chloroflexota bacterium]